MSDETTTLTEQLGLASSERRVSPSASPEFPEQDLFVDSDDYRAFVCSRGVTRQADMLICSLKDGSHDAFEYSHRYRCRLDGQGIHLEFSEHDVRLRGFRLWDVYLKLCIRRVLRVFEADKPTEQLLMPTDEPLITMIEIKRRASE